ncbi:MAG: hypothetical protein HQL73_06990 [Magnetococcales bacterium]|nr:hypothetical protein [Magnetococcales bacterium]
MNHQTRPLLKSPVLVVVGGLLIVGVTLLGLSSNHADLIREDVRIGPVIAAIRILLPMFAVIGVVHYIANIKKCAHCGKILFWKRQKSHHP